MSLCEWNKKEELVTDQSLRHLRTYHQLFQAFTTNERSELALILKMQEFCYENMNFMNSFNKILVLFYKREYFIDLIVCTESVLKFRFRCRLFKDFGARVIWLDLKLVVSYSIWRSIVPLRHNYSRFHWTSPNQLSSLIHSRDYLRRLNSQVVPWSSLTERQNALFGKDETVW